MGSGKIQWNFQLLLGHHLVDHAIVPGPDLQPDEVAQPIALAADVIQSELQPLGLVVWIV